MTQRKRPARRCMLPVMNVVFRPTPANTVLAAFCNPIAKAKAATASGPAPSGPVQPSTTSADAA